MDLFVLAWKNIWRNKRRTLITLAAMSLSLMLTQAFHNLAIGMYEQMIDSGVRAGSGHLSVYRGDYARSRDEGLFFAEEAPLLRGIRAIEGVEEVLPRVYLPALAQSSRESRGVLLMGVDPVQEAAINPFLRGVEKNKMLRSASGRDAIIGDRLLKELQISAGSKFVVTLQNSRGELVGELFRVRGVIHTGLRHIDGGMIMVGKERAAQMVGRPGEVHELAVVLHKNTDRHAAFTALSDLVSNRPRVQVLTWEQAMPNLANAIKLDYVSQKFIFVIILLIVTIGVVNTLLMSVMERIREFGVILAVGLTPGRLRSMVMVEALILGLLSLFFGTLLGSAVTWYFVNKGLDLRAFMSESLEFGGVVFDPVLRAAWDWPWMVQIALYVLILCLVASLYPAVKAARLSPATAMRKT